ncbi:MAG: hypothetical protein JWN40_3849 [Phycisphaerales bacterium]|nr:hypothetical protein [Phycisphaerales bacterium]
MAKKQFDLTTLLDPTDIIRRLQKRRDELMSEVDLIDGEIVRFGGGIVGRKPPKGTKIGKPKGKRRVKRTADQLIAHAQQIVEFIKAAGKEGVSGKDINAKFDGVNPSAKQFLKTHAPDTKIKTSGKRAAMRYVIG